MTIQDEKLIKLRDLDELLSAKRAEIRDEIETIQQEFPFSATFDTLTKLNMEYDKLVEEFNDVIKSL